MQSLTNFTPAAQYLRMSTERQEYSLEYQALAIQEYARNHDFRVVQTYADGARSGLVIRRRAALQSLLQDVVCGNAQFKAVLVYDVSRWGRFQDADEAAHYGFL
jgi:DNA invertase Pin-like site-specific DNA recombinase